MTTSEQNLFKLPFGPPPILSSIEDDLKSLIECPEKLPIHQLDNVQCYWPQQYNVMQLLNYDLAPIGTTIKYKRDPITGSIGDVHEFNLPGVGKTSKNSMSMNRAPGPPSDGVRGNSSNFLFWPGGFDEPDKDDCNLTIDIDFENNLKHSVRGIKSGIRFQPDNRTPLTDQWEKAENDVPGQSGLEDINMMHVVDQESNSLIVSSMQTVVESNNQNKDKKPVDLVKIDDDITQLSESHKIPVLKISESNNMKTVRKEEWAEQLNESMPVPDFHKKVPDPALTFPYELDNFQKQAIIKLEESCNVFVAAHTSAGKTTVAEYAIALSQKHMTRTIYTSPIKALSNQKFREFKEKFESVGLITGDIQINVTASCLIMTTEILQSMLYGASEVIRDLEYVIFDEVHYINNEDRGHVWEEIVILLPPTVTIVMLSATVPNPIEFANWVGKIKQRKMYVISTAKRPVPLQHFLYTGYDMKTKDDVFLVVDTDGSFKDRGWQDASKAIENADKKPISKGPRGPKKVNKSAQLIKTLGEKNGPGQEPDRKSERRSEASKWAPLLNHLIENDKLPVVVFTFSRKRCNHVATSMVKHLITKDQQEEVEAFFRTAIKRLKDSDANLPQVHMIRKLLLTGIGIHHSGILPILKEIVEMLFQKGLVKMLFATETFAMGVNMPARTVIFDSVVKFDGNAFRMVHPTEYIQMAGRAGRRGHDPIGTVLIYCKKDVPSCTGLVKMMCGKPQSLQSRFKVTYSMVLHLRRLSETISVKDMMRRSFGEASTQCNQKQCMYELEQLETKMQSSKCKDMSENAELNNLYDLMLDYMKLWKILSPVMMKQKQVAKMLKEERVLIISYDQHVHKLAIIVGENHQNGTWRVFVLKECKRDLGVEDNEKSLRWYRMKAVPNQRIYIPNGSLTYEILTISAENIHVITSHTIKCDLRAIMSNWENCQIYKSKDAVPHQAAQKAIDQLLRLSTTGFNDPSLLAPAVQMRIDDVNLLAMYQRMGLLKLAIDQHFCKRDIMSEFEQVFEYRQLLDEKEKLRQMLSGETMEHYTEYKSRVEILKSLGYIDQDERVTLKGRVALEMSTHELLLTELVLKNILTDWDPAEIAAMISALVFQKKPQQNNNVIEDKQPSRLQQLEKIVQNEFNILNCKEMEYMLPMMAPINFELVYVVYKWAKQEPFASIMKHTDIQEGIIVRCIQQLNETLRDVRNAAIIIGNPILKTKMEQASTAIKRDIVFAASLYTQN